MPETIQIAFCETSDLFRLSFQKYLDSHLDLNVVICEKGLQKIIPRLVVSNIDVIILDLTEDDQRNFPMFQYLKQRENQLPVIIFSNYENIKQNFILSKYCGASAFFSKQDGNPDTIINTIRKIKSTTQKEIIIDDTFRKSLLVNWFKKEEEFSFTLREKQVLNGIFEGKINTEIAKDIGVSVRTVESHRTRIIERTNSKSIIGALIKALKSGHLFDH